LKSYIVQNENALFHECAFSCDNALFLKLNDEAFFITDARYTTEAKERVKNATVVEAKELLKAARAIIKKQGIKSLFYDPRTMSAQSFQFLSKSVKLLPAKNLSLKKREVKSEDEVKLLRQAVDEGARAFDRFCEFIKKDGIGKSEEELFFNAELIFKDRGRLGLSFSPIVAINENAAKPHALPSKKILKEGDLLLLDAGVTYERYHSDRTRTVEIGADFNFGKAQKFKDKTRQKVYDSVLLAQEAAIKKAKVGVKASDIDKAARDVIEKAGYGKYFIHSTGHGVGLDIHELPVISSKSSAVIQEGMVFTIEPGIYLPNEFGVRIEDMVGVIDGEIVVL
jgi:Xaa-Pro aminopeptidase